ncbi:MAG: PP2C family serine/threonine-protein phosphatase, partial [Myxococcota bacterium]
SLKLFLVADGMWGHACGEVASAMAIETVLSFWQDNLQDHEKTWPHRMVRELTYEENLMSNAVSLANRKIYERSCSSRKYKGMGTTFIGLHIHKQHAFVGHVGDSRVYMLRDGVLKQLTEDHSLLNDYRKLKHFSEQELKNFPHKNVIVRALGMRETVRVDVLKQSLQEGDLFLLCSDGLSGLVEDDQLTEILSNTDETLTQRAQSLIDAANYNGGNDNITALLVQAVASS